MTKVCTMCHKEKPRQEFYDNISCADGYTPKCKKCSNKMKRWYDQQRKLKKKERVLPFVYHPRAPLNPIPVPNDVKIIHQPITVVFN